MYNRPRINKMFAAGVVLLLALLLRVTNLYGQTPTLVTASDTLQAETLFPRVAFCQVSQAGEAVLTIPPSQRDVYALSVYVSFPRHEGEWLYPQDLPDFLDEAEANVEEFYREMSHDQHIFHVKRFLRPDEPGKFIITDREAWEYREKPGELTKEVFDKIHAWDANAFYKEGTREPMDVVFLNMTTKLYDFGTARPSLGNHNSPWYSGRGTISQFWLCPAQGLECDLDQDVLEWSICHEYGHILGLADHLEFWGDPADDRLYYGRYSLMFTSDGPVGLAPFCLRNLIYLGWLQVKNVEAPLDNEEIKDIRALDGIIYKVAVDAREPDDSKEYFLFANHQGTGFDGKYPGKGLLIWHILEGKLWDIESAHGKYRDPYFDEEEWLGEWAPVDGLDPLDFYDVRDYSGSPGDFFDGVERTEFSPTTNPSTNRYTGSNRSSPEDRPSNFGIFNIRQQGTSIIADINPAYYGENQISSDQTWSGTMHIANRQAIMPGVTVWIQPNTDIVFDGATHLDSYLTVASGGAIVALGGGTTVSHPDRIHYHGSITTDNTWGFPIELADPLTVSNGATLTILPGSTVTYNRVDASITVEDSARFVADGAAGQITFELSASAGTSSLYPIKFNHASGQSTVRFCDFVNRTQRLFFPVSVDNSFNSGGHLALDNCKFISEKGVVFSFKNSTFDASHVSLKTCDFSQLQADYNTIGFYGPGKVTVVDSITVPDRFVLRMQGTGVAFSSPSAIIVAPGGAIGSVEVSLDYPNSEPVPLLYRGDITRYNNWAFPAKIDYELRVKDGGSIWFEERASLTLDGAAAQLYVETGGNVSASQTVVFDPPDRRVIYEGVRFADHEMEFEWGFPVLLKGNLYVSGHNTLYMNDGTSVKFDGDSHIEVEAGNDILAYSPVSFDPPDRSVVIHGGDLGFQHFWGFPVEVRSPIVIPDYGRLKIHPGTEVSYLGSANTTMVRVTPGGKVTAVGEEFRPVTFKRAPGASDNWTVFRIESQECTFSYCEFSEAQRQLQFDSPSGSNTVDNCLFYKPERHSIYFSEGAYNARDIDLNSCTFPDGGSLGWDGEIAVPEIVRIPSGVTLDIIEDSRITFLNGQYIRVEDGGAVTARGDNFSEVVLKHGDGNRKNGFVWVYGTDDQQGPGTSVPSVFQYTKFITGEGPVRFFDRATGMNTTIENCQFNPEKYAFHFYDMTESDIAGAITTWTGPGANNRFDLQPGGGIYVILPEMAPFTKIRTGEVATDFEENFGCSWQDYDQDGDLDLYVTNDLNPDYLYSNNGDGTFTKITSGVLVTTVGESRGNSWGDYDNDGDPDLFVANLSGEDNFLYRNEGSGNYTLLTDGAIVSDEGNSYACSWGDYDNDGYLDMFVGNLYEDNFLYHNDGPPNYTFTKITRGHIVNDAAPSYGCGWGDYDNDGDLDLFVANFNHVDNFLYNNDGSGGFTRITSGALVNDGASSRACSWGDYDNDGYLDLFVANFDFEKNFLYHNNGDGTFVQITDGPIVNDRAASNGGNWADYDNDGYLDLFVANDSQDNNLYRNNGDGTFSKLLSGDIVNDVGNSNGSTWGDYDNDGDLDLFVANWISERNFLYQNDGNQNRWVKIECAGTTSNASAIGAKVRVKARSSRQQEPVWQMQEISGQMGYFSQNSIEAEFGLGDATIIDSVKIEWPSGNVQYLTNQPVNQVLRIEEKAESTSMSSLVGDMNDFRPGDTADRPRISDEADDLRIALLDEFQDAGLGDSVELDIGGANRLVALTHFFDFPEENLTGARLRFRFRSDDAGVRNDLIVYKTPHPDSLKPDTTVLALADLLGFEPAPNIPYLVDLDLAKVPVRVAISKDWPTGQDGWSGAAADTLNLLPELFDGQLDLVFFDDTNLDFSQLVMEFGAGAATPAGDYIVTAPMRGVYVTFSEVTGSGSTTASRKGGGYPIPPGYFHGTVPAYYEIETTAEFKPVAKLEIHYDESQFAEEKNVRLLHLEDGTFVDRTIWLDTRNHFVSAEVDSLSEFVVVEAEVETAIHEPTHGQVPRDYALLHNYPNPFNATTTIIYALPHNAEVELSIYNLRGQLVRTLVSGAVKAGQHKVVWDGADSKGTGVASGLYVYRLEAKDPATGSGQDFVAHRKLVLIK